MRLSSCFSVLSSRIAAETFGMAGICTDFGAILPLDSPPGDELRQSIQETGVTGVARMEFQLATTANLGLRGAGSGFPQLVRETLSKNEVLPGLT